MFYRQIFTDVLASEDIVSGDERSNLITHPDRHLVRIADLSCR